MKTFEVALFERIPVDGIGPFLTAWHREEGKERVFPGYIRVTKWVTVDFPPRDDIEAEAEAAKELQAARDRAARDVAALDAKLSGLKS